MDRLHLTEIYLTDKGEYFYKDTYLGDQYPTVEELSKRLQRLNKQTGKERLREELKHLRTIAALKGANRTRISITRLARRSYMCREMAGRFLKQLEEEGAISRRGFTIQFLN